MTFFDRFMTCTLVCGAVLPQEAHWFSALITSAIVGSVMAGLWHSVAE